MEVYSPKRGMNLFFKSSKAAIYKPILLKCFLNLTNKNSIIESKHHIHQISKCFIKIIWLYRKKFHFSLVTGDGNNKIDAIIEDISKSDWRKKKYSNLILKKAWDFLCYYVIYLLRSDTHFYHFLDKNDSCVQVPWNCKSQSVFNKFKEKIEFIQIREDVAQFWHENFEIIKRSVDFELVNQLEKLNDSPHISEKIASKIPRKRLRHDEHELLHTFQLKKCFYCSEPLVRSENVHEDHLIPWSFILETKLENIVLACENCNLHKSDILPSSEYLTKIIDRNKSKSFLDAVWSIYKLNKIWKYRGKEELFNFFIDSENRLKNLFERCKNVYKFDWVN